MPSSYPPTEEPRDQILRVCLSASERATMDALALSRGRSLSETIRTYLPLDQAPTSTEGRLTVTLADESANPFLRGGQG